MRQLLSSARPGFDQVPSPGFVEKYCSLFGTPSPFFGISERYLFSVIFRP